MRYAVEESEARKLVWPPSDFVGVCILTACRWFFPMPCLSYFLLADASLRCHVCNALANLASKKGIGNQMYANTREIACRSNKLLRFRFFHCSHCPSELRRYCSFASGPFLIIHPKSEDDEIDALVIAMIAFLREWRWHSAQLKSILLPANLILTE